MVDIGSILLANLKVVEDVNFVQSVILIADSNESGAVGFIQNKEMKNTQVSDLISDLSFNSNMYYGGPVQNDTAHFIHRFGNLAGCTKIFDNVFWGGDFDEIKLLCKHGIANSTNTRFFVGYSGWSVDESEQIKDYFRVVPPKTSSSILNSTFNIDWEKVYLDQIGNNLVNYKPSISHKELIEECEKFISEFKLKKVVDALLGYGALNPDLVVETMTLSGQISKVQSDNNLGLIDYSTYILHMNRLQYSLINIIRKVS